MDTNIEKFNKYWETVEKETLSCVRRQMKTRFFDIADVNHDFQRSCSEWFRGKLAPSIWYQELVESHPAKASAFKDCIMRIQLKDVSISRPNGFWTYLLTMLSLPVVFLCLDYVTDWALLGETVFTIGLPFWSGLPVKSSTAL